MLLKGLVRRITTGSSRHRDEELRPSPRLGLLDRVSSPAVPGRVMAHCWLVGDDEDLSSASLNRGRHSADTHRKKQTRRSDETKEDIFPPSDSFRKPVEASAHLYRRGKNIQY